MARVLRQNITESGFCLAPLFCTILGYSSLKIKRFSPHGGWSVQEITTGLPTNKLPQCNISYHACVEWHSHFYFLSV